ncbi:hypothetical protein IAT38_001572 [Cryptococcus sp. DSM 104549]
MARVPFGLPLVFFDLRAIGIELPFMSGEGQERDLTQNYGLILIRLSYNVAPNVDDVCLHLPSRFEFDVFEFVEKMLPTYEPKTATLHNVHLCYLKEIPVVASDWVVLHLQDAGTELAKANALKMRTEEGAPGCGCLQFDVLVTYLCDKIQFRNDILDGTPLPNAASSSRHRFYPLSRPDLEVHNVDTSDYPSTEAYATPVKAGALPKSGLRPEGAVWGPKEDKEWGGLKIFGKRATECNCPWVK